MDMLKDGLGSDECQGFGLWAERLDAPDKDGASLDKPLVEVVVSL